MHWLHFGGFLLVNYNTQRTKSKGKNTNYFSCCFSWHWTFTLDFDNNVCKHGSEKVSTNVYFKTDYNTWPGTMYLLQLRTSFMDLSIHTRLFMKDDNEQPNGIIYQLGGHAWKATSNNNTKTNIG
jgi:hypothetical protein